MNQGQFVFKFYIILSLKAEGFKPKTNFQWPVTIVFSSCV